MPPSHGNVELEHELGRAMPPRFCRGRWRQMLIAFTAIAAIVLGVALNERLSYRAPVLAVFAPVGSAESAETTSVAAADPADGQRVVLVAAQRTAFNRAAQTIRPSVLSIRASFDPKNGRDLERTGSAVIVDARGYAVTCLHVVAGATRVLARRFRDQQRWLPAQLIASEGDLALFKLNDSAPFSPAKLASSERVQVGDWVLAVGYPFDLGLTVTAGIVGRRRATLELPNGQRYDGLLQTDAPINQGSSGGPLIDTSGEVIGLNTAIYAPTGVFSGAGFAIPSDRVRQFVERALGGELRASAALPIGWGVTLVDLTPNRSAQLAYPAATGAIVNRVVPGSPAEAAQLAAGDVVTAIAGETVIDVASVRQIRDRLEASAAVPIRVWRRGASLTLMLQPQPTAG